jgi:hypothetical protein
MRLSKLLSKQSIILIYVEQFGRHEFSNGPLQFEILVKKAPQIKKDGR